MNEPNEEMNDIQNEFAPLLAKFKRMVGRPAEPEPVQLDADGQPIITYKNVLHCDKCDDTGIAVRIENGELKGEVCKCDAKRKSMIALKKSGLEQALKEFRFDNFPRQTEYHKRMFDIAQAFIPQTEFPFCGFWGQRGTGKTHIGTAICGEFIDQGKRTLYTIFDTLMAELKAHQNSEDYEDVLNKYALVEVLYIDDFMKPYEGWSDKLQRKAWLDPSPADVKQAENLINFRYLNKKRTIITSERFLSEIVQIEPALGGRIKRCCGQYTMAIERDDSRDYRLRK